MNVTHYSGFKSDNRLSMDIYASSLAKELVHSHIQLETFKPKSRFERFSGNKYLMRYLRYVAYPLQLPKAAKGVHHVLDHGYAHLYSKLGPGKKCITAHDLIPLLHWKGKLGLSPSDSVLNQSRIAKPALNMYSLSFLKHFDRVISVSESTKNDLLEYLDIPVEKIAVIPPIISPLFKTIESAQVAAFAQRQGLSKKCRWIMISGQEFYKNHTTSLRVLKRLVHEMDGEVMLIKTGTISEDFNTQVQLMGLQNHVKSLFIKDIAELPLLYNFVDCLLFPSFYEGFGMPVAEALACGTPVVTSDRGSLPEVAGAMATILDPFDDEAIGDAVIKILLDPSIRERIKVAGPQWVEQYRGPCVVEKIERLYQEL